MSEHERSDARVNGGSGGVAVFVAVVEFMVMVVVNMVF